jgi:hypothetical protein
MIKKARPNENNLRRNAGMHHDRPLFVAFLAPTTLQTTTIKRIQVYYA